MPKKTILLLAVCFSLQAGLCLALDSKKLHEEADKAALADALSSVGRFPDSIDSLYLLSLVYLNLHRDKEAGEVFNKIRALEPEAFEAKWGLAEVMRRLHKLNESKKALEELINSNPGFCPAYISLAYIRYIEQDFTGSLRLANKVIRQDRANADLSNYVRALVLIAANKGMLAHYGGPFSKVINGSAVFPALKKAQKLQPDSAAVMFGLGSFYLLAPALGGGNAKEAERYLKKALEKDPLFAEAYVRLAQFYKTKGDLAKYETYLGKALEIDPQNELALDIKSGRCEFICLKP